MSSGKEIEVNDSLSLTKGKRSHESDDATTIGDESLNRNTKTGEMTYISPVLTDKTTRTENGSDDVTTIDDEIKRSIDKVNNWEVMNTAPSDDEVENADPIMTVPENLLEGQIQIYSTRRTSGINLFASRLSSNGSRCDVYSSPDHSLFEYLDPKDTYYMKIANSLEYSGEYLLFCIGLTPDEFLDFNAQAVMCNGKVDDELICKLKPSIKSKVNEYYKVFRSKYYGHILPKKTYADIAQSEPELFKFENSKLSGPEVIHRSDGMQSLRDNRSANTTDKKYEGRTGLFEKTIKMYKQFIQDKEKERKKERQDLLDRISAQQRQIELFNLSKSVANEECENKIKILTQELENTKQHYAQSSTELEKSKKRNTEMVELQEKRNKDLKKTYEQQVTNLNMSLKNAKTQIQDNRDSYNDHIKVMKGELKSQMSQLKNTYDQSITKCKQESETLQQQYDQERQEAEKRFDLLNIEVQESYSTIINKENEISLLRNKIEYSNQIKQNLTESQNQVAELKKKLMETETKISLHAAEEENHTKLHLELGNIKAENKSLQSQVQHYMNLERDLAKLKVELIQMESLLAEKDSKIAEIESQLGESETKTAKMETQNKQLIDNNTKLETDIENITAEREKCQLELQMFKQLELDFANLKQKLAQVESELTEKKSETQKMCSKLADHGSKLSAKDLKISEMESTLGSKSKEVDNLRAKLETANQDLAQYKRKSDNYRQNNRDLDRKLKTAEDLNRSYMRMDRQKENTNEALNKQITDLNAQCESYKNEVEVQKNKVSNMLFHVNKIHDDKVKLEENFSEKEMLQNQLILTKDNTISALERQLQYRDASILSKQPDVNVKSPLGNNNRSSDGNQYVKHGSDHTMNQYQATNYDPRYQIQSNRTNSSFGDSQTNYMATENNYKTARGNDYQKRLPECNNNNSGSSSGNKSGNSSRRRKRRDRRRNSNSGNSSQQSVSQHNTQPVIKQEDIVQDTPQQRTNYSGHQQAWNEDYFIKECEQISFDGKYWPAFSATFDMLAKQTNWDDRTAAWRFRICLRDRALECWGKLHKSVQDSYMLTHQFFQQYFGQTDTPQIARMRLTECKQKANEDIDDFYLRVQLLANDALGDLEHAQRDSYCRDTFLMGLRDQEISCLVRNQHGHKSFQETYQTARENIFYKEAMRTHSYRSKDVTHIDKDTSLKTRRAAYEPRNRGYDRKYDTYDSDSSDYDKDVGRGRHRKITERKYRDRQYQRSSSNSDTEYYSSSRKRNDGHNSGKKNKTCYDCGSRNHLKGDKRCKEYDGNYKSNSSGSSRDRNRGKISNSRDRGSDNPNWRDRGRSDRSRDSRRHDFSS